jgi:chromosome segregation ATPase
MALPKWAETALNTQEREIEKLKQQLADSGRIIKELKSDLGATDELYDEAQKNNDTAHQIIDDQSLEIKRLSDIAEARRIEANSKLTDVCQLEAEIVKLKQQLADSGQLAKEIADLADARQAEIVKLKQEAAVLSQ